MVKLTTTMLEKRRTIKIFNEWVKDVYRKFDTKEGRENWRLNKGLVKQVKEEMYPLAEFCTCYFGDNQGVEIQYLTGNQNYDAEVFYTGKYKSPIKYLEVTQARNGEEEYLRDLLINEGRLFSVYETIEKEGTKNTGIKLTTSGNGSISHERLIKDTVNIIVR